MCFIFLGQYYNLPDLSVDYYYYNLDGNQPSPIILDVTYYKEGEKVFDPNLKNVDTSTKTCNFSM